ncbi:enoyl-CoA hydratase/isomerase family protein [Nocardioides sp. R-C-SC26]|uniref:enoyl-CoA hydratase/isomerase family protein n=1 Tax=Nocardioides sp. R-C-SC26 TaxID=2870414 RepID=UPI001E28872E|nr:enoyl-CoA hydratase/isomerase family protein [Nocardioides sp. R-C-SC26]
MSTSASTAVRRERRGPASWAVIDRPDRANACGTPVMAALEAWLDDAERDTAVRVLVLAGAGGIFCPGADLKEAGSLAADRDALVAFLRRGRDLVTRLRSARVPVIAAVDGVAFAGGLELMLACDLVMATPRARIGDRHLSQGQVPGWGSSALLAAAIGATSATRLLLGGEIWTAEQAQEIGLVGDVVPIDRLDARVAEAVDVLAAHDADAVDRMLRLTRRRSADLDDALELEWQVLLEHVDRSRAREHAAAFRR